MALSTVPPWESSSRMGIGAVLTYWCAIGCSAIGTPARRPIFGPQMPAQQSTISASIRPWSVTTADMRPLVRSKPVTVTRPWNSMPAASAARPIASAASAGRPMQSSGT